MKKWFRKLLPSFLVCFVCLTSILIGIFYFNYISDHIYEDSTGHLQEIYGQVNRSFSTFADRNWGLLDSWGEYLAKTDTEENNTFADFIAKEQERWKFTRFYFISENKTYKTPDGAESGLDLGEAWHKLTQEKEPVIASENFTTGQAVTVFAVPVEPGVYNGFHYVAIAVSYTNEALASSLDVDAFAGKARCFIINDDGNVMLSTQPGGSVFSNYLTYLSAASDIDKNELEKIKNDWKNETSGLLRCNINGEDYCILYQPVSYHGYVLLSAVPQEVVSAGFLQVQNTTATVLIIIFMLLTAAGIILIFLRNNKQVLKSKTELAYRDRMFDVLSNNVDDIFLMLDKKNYQVDYISPNVERLLGIPAKEVREDVRTMTKCAVDFDIVIPVEKMESIPLNKSIHQECEFLHQTTGERRWYRMTVYRMDIQGTEKYINILSDRTQERQMNQTMQEALLAAKSANEAKSNFLSNMSHDIRTPMNAIVGFSVLLEKDAENPDKVREYTHKITASSHHLLSLINEVLDMSKIESGKTSLNSEVFRLPELLEELVIILRPQAKAKKQGFTIHTHGNPPEQLIGDKLRLNQILINLLSNAVKYTPEGGKIDFQVCSLPESTPQVAKLRFVVKDNGIGMSEEYLENIFSPFSREVNSVTNKVQGTGLGMAITKSLIDLMGGVIQVKSKPGKGSTFIVELSFAMPEEETENWYQHKVTSILVADDELEICQTIKEMMHDTGVDVSYVTDGNAAVEAAATAHQNGTDYNVILLDWKMPGMDGVETARRIRERIGTNVPILVLTSYDWSDIEKEAKQAGIQAFMPKPFFVSTFWQAIRPLLSAAPEQTAPVPEDKTESVMYNRRFLIVEDNELNSEILTEMLDMEGASCELAVNGNIAVEMFKKSSPGYYDMIFMDVQMPVMNGYDATKIIRASNHPDAANIPIVAMTANTFAEDVRQALDAGMNGHLAKPINMDAIREMVKKLINKSD